MPPLAPTLDNLQYEAHVFDFAFHPDGGIVAAGLITGDIICRSFSEVDESAVLFSTNPHKSSCRTVEYGLDGKDLYSAGKDRSLVVLDADSGKLKLRKPNAHPEAINRLLSLAPNLIASGDDAGVVKLWDLRARKEVRNYTEHGDFISDLAYLEDKSTLIATSADGTLSVYDVRKQKPIKVCDNQDEELLSVAFVRNGTKAVVGTEEGVLSFFTFSDWGDCTDRFPGHPGSIDTLCKVDEDAIVTGSDDGSIRVITLFPHTLVGVLGDHGDSSVERVRVTSDGFYCGSTAHDNMLKFWSLRPFGLTGSGGEEDDSDSDDDRKGGADEGADLEPDGDGDLDGGASTAGKRVLSDADSDASEDPVKRKRGKKAKSGFKTATKANSFFADLD
ncbi:WD repeat-containing protein jip5 [Irineochytrium annulatum]|nr:WD repeat-containing protein jip5 [Irineochytrium annulatum]